MISFLSSFTCGTHSLVSKCNVSSLSITNSRDWTCCTSNIIFYDWGSHLWTALTLSKYTDRTLNWAKIHFLVTSNYNPWPINLQLLFINLPSVLLCATLPADFLFKYWLLPPLTRIVRNKTIKILQQFHSFPMSQIQVSLLKDVLQTLMVDL